MVFDEIDSALTLWDRLKKWYYTKNNPPVETIAARFVRLFETHGVHRNQIPRFIGHGLMLKDVQDDAALLSKLDEALLTSACALFAVRREWLDGAETQAHPQHDFYKRPEEFQYFLNEMIAANPEGVLHGMLIAPEAYDSEAEALLVFQETIGWVGDNAIYRFHLCNNWSYTYWKSRAYLTACVAMAWRRRVFVTGTTMDRKEIDKLKTGETLLGWQGEGVWIMGGKKWYPEDMALRPDVFLQGIDSERNNFGITAGLSLWLDLEAHGLMVTGLPGETEAKQLFMQELAKY